MSSPTRSRSRLARREPRPPRRGRQGLDDDHRRCRRFRAIKGRIKQQKAEVADSDSHFDRETLLERLAKLSGGVAVVKVGAATETEMKEKKHRVRGRAAGHPRGARRGDRAWRRRRAAQCGEGDRARRLRRSRRAGGRADHPPRTRGTTPPTRLQRRPRGSVVVDNVRKSAKGQGLNVDTNELDDLVKAGIIDPTMVTRAALQNAASIAKNILMTEAIVAEPPEKVGAGMAGGMGGMGDMGGMM
jgi:chaperonin GroEL